jgi:3D (Asp-Asp-Asp) domain-containing protein
VSARALWLSVGLVSCTTAGSAWMDEPLPNAEQGFGELEPQQKPPAKREVAQRPPQTTRVLGEQEPSPDEPEATSSGGPPMAAKIEGTKIEGKKGEAKKIEGKVLGTFRNTYYDFPSEADFEGTPVALKNARCETIKQVPSGFYESVCVQGSGTLASGSTVSFNKRDCACAPICPRTSQNICFDQLDPKDFPWGRGATGKAITPLLTVAVDSTVIPLDTPIYIPEYDGAARDAERTSTHDGCFIAQDRGIRIKGNHVDIFTGHRSITELWNRLVPSNKGVTVVLDSPRCARAK